MMRSMVKTLLALTLITGEASAPSKMLYDWSGKSDDTSSTDAKAP